jgi:hypothetical protein
MRTLTLPLPVFGFVISTRAALGVGLGLLIAGRLSAERRRKVGLTLLGIGVATTIPAISLIRRSMRAGRTRTGVDRDPRLIGATRYPRKGDEVQA